MNLKELEKQLKEFERPAKAEMTDEEMNTLRAMFSVPNSMETLFKFLVGIESEKGTRLAYDIENINLAGDVEDVLQQIKFQKVLIQFARMKLEKIRLLVKEEIQSEINEKKEELKKQREEEEEKEKEQTEEVGKYI